MQVTYYCEDEEMVEQGNWWLIYCDLLNIFAYLNEPWYSNKKIRLTAYCTGYLFYTLCLVSAFKTFTLKVLLSSMRKKTLTDVEWCLRVFFFYHLKCLNISEGIDTIDNTETSDVGHVIFQILQKPKLNKTGYFQSDLFLLFFTQLYYKNTTQCWRLIWSRLCLGGKGP